MKPVVFVAPTHHTSIAAERVGERAVAARIPDGARSQLVQGTWDATCLLLEAGDQIEQVGLRLPYVAGY